MTLLKHAYTTGRNAALLKFAFGDSPDDLASALGAGGALYGGGAGAGLGAGIGAGFTAPEGYGAGQALRTGLGAASGAALGEAGGTAAAKLLASLMKANPELFATIGGRAGEVLGGAVGAHGGHTWADHATAEAMRRERLMGGA